MKRLCLLLGAVCMCACLLSCDPMLFGTFERMTKIITLDPAKEGDSLLLIGQFIDVSERDAGRPYGFYYSFRDAAGTVLSEDTVIVDSIKTDKISAGFKYRYKLGLSQVGLVEYSAVVDKGGELIFADFKSYEVQPIKTSSFYIQSVSDISSSDAYIRGIIERSPIDGLNIVAVGLEIKPPSGNVASFEYPVSIQSYPFVVEHRYTDLQGEYNLPPLMPNTEYGLVLLVRLSNNSLYRSAEVRFRTMPAL